MPSRLLLAAALFALATVATHASAQPIPKKEAPPKLDLKKIIAAEAALTKMGCQFVRETNKQHPLVNHTRVINFPVTTSDADILKAMPHLTELPALTAIDLGSTKITDLGLQQLAGLPDIEAFYLDGTDITDRGLVPLVELKRLYWLDLNNTKITAAGLKTVGKFTNLEHLTLLGLTPVTDADIAALSGLTWMRNLTLPTAGLTEGCLKHLAEMRLLTHFNFYFSVSDEGAKTLGTFRRLENLGISGKLTDAGLQSLLGCTSLRTLTVSGAPQVTAAQVTGFDLMTKLTHLSLNGTGVTDEGLKVIAKAPALTSLEIGGTKVTGAGLPDLVPLKKLARLHLDGTGADNKGLQSLEKYRNLMSITAVNTKINVTGANRYMAMVPGSKVVIEYPKLPNTPVGPAVVGGPPPRPIRTPTAAGSPGG